MTAAEKKAAAAAENKTTAVATRNEFLTATTSDLLMAARTANSEEMAMKIFDAVEEIGDENYIALAADYRKFEAGEVANVYVTDISEINNQYKDQIKDAPDMVPVVCFKMQVIENKEKVIKDFINADAVFVSTVLREVKKNPNILPCFFRVEAMGEVKSKNGKYLQMKVGLLYAQATN